MSEPVVAAESPETRPGHSPWLVLATLCVGFFMILLDTTIVNIAIPELTDDLGATLDQVLWIVNAYTLTYAVLLITGGRLGDLYGPKRLFLAGLVVFTVASAACGLAQSPSQLVATRVVQAVGGAMLTPQTLAILTMIFPVRRRGAAYGIWGAVAGLATIAGPTVGGWLVTEWGWRWIFYVNVPIGIAAMVLGALILPDLRLNRRHRLDWQGTLLVSGGLFAICFGLIEGPSHQWGRVAGPISIPVIIGTGVVLIGLFGWHQYATRDREPLVPLRIFADRNYALMSAVVAAISFGMLGLFLPLVIFLQSVLGLSALQAGLVLAPMSLASVASAPFAGRMADKYGGKGILAFGLVLWALGVYLLLKATRVYYDKQELITALVIAGFGIGMTFAPLQSIAMHNVEARMAGAAAGLINTTRQLGAVIGSAAVGALLQAQLVARLPVQAEETATGLPDSLRFRFVDGFSRIKATRGLEIGTHQTGVHLPPDIPESVRPAVLQYATKTFHDAYIGTMKTTLILPLTVLGAAALAVLLVRRNQPDGDEPDQDAQPDQPPLKNSISTGASADGETS